MYTLAIQREFIAQHYHTDERDDEKKLKSFRYKAELMIEGDDLDQQGYVVDFDELGAQFDGVLPVSSASNVRRMVPERTLSPGRPDICSTGIVRRANVLP